MTTILQLRREDISRYEPLGTKNKYWFRLEDGTQWLFKYDERAAGSDWAELVVDQLCGLLGIPHAEYQYAEYKGDLGVACKSIVYSDFELVGGQDLLLERDSSYPQDTNKYKNSRHTLEAVWNAVKGLEMPPAAWLHGVPAQVINAAEIFAGYLFLDVWVSNQDRHHENWSALRDGKILHLAPTFDHGAALANILQDDERAERLHTRDHQRSIETFVEKSRSAIYPDESTKRPLLLLDAFKAFAKYVPNATVIWQQRLATINDNAIQSVLDEMREDRMSPICKQFTMKLLQANRDRLLKLH